MYYGPDKTFWTPVNKAKKGDRVNCQEKGWKTITSVKEQYYEYEVTFTGGTTVRLWKDDRLEIV